MKRLTIHLHGGLERFVSERGPTELEVDDNATLAVVQSLLGIPPGEVGLFAVDRELKAEDDGALDGAIVDMYPLFGGG